MTPAEWTDLLAPRFASAWADLDISNDDFIRTTEPRHHRAVQAFLGRIHDNGWIVKDTYRGLYCVPCEQYYAEDELLEGDLCPVHRRPVELLEEENYFFRLSAFQQRLIDWYEAAPDAVVPESKRNEALSFIKGGLRDISITRTSIDWGVPVPWDERHVFYVWYDALINYLTAIGYGSDERAVRGVVAGGPPPDRQGDHPVPLRVVAGHVHGGRHRPAGPRAGPRVAAGGWGEDVQVQPQPDRPGRAHRRVRGRPGPLPPAPGHPPRAPTATSPPRASTSRYNADLANNLGNLLSAGGHGGRLQVRGHRPGARPGSRLAAVAATCWPKPPPPGTPASPTPASRRPGG